MQTQRQLLRLSSANLLFPSLPPPPFPQYHLYFPGRHHYYSLCSAHRAEWLASAAVEPAAEGPIELLSSISSFLSAASDDSGALQSAASFLITGSFALFLFSTLRRSAKRAKQRKLRSGLSSKEEAIESLKKASNAALKVKGKKKKNPPSADEALLGALIAAAFGVLLYKFTTTVEFNLNNQPLSPNYSVRQITITIRTIINGMCYLATFLFAFNSLGLFLYSGKLAMNSYVNVRTSEDEARLNSSYTSKSPEDKSDDQSSDNTQK